MKIRYSLKRLDDTLDYSWLTCLSIAACIVEEFVFAIVDLKHYFVLSENEYDLGAHKCSQCFAMAFQNFSSQM